MLDPLTHSPTVANGDSAYLSSEPSYLWRGRPELASRANNEALPSYGIKAQSSSNSVAGLPCVELTHDLSSLQYSIRQYGTAKSQPETVIGC